MGYEIRVKYHPKKSEGIGYDAEKVEEQVKKVGKPFDDTGLEKLAGAVMAQLARRDVMVVDLEIDELVRKPVSFKEASDGRGIILKNKKFSLDKTASLVADDLIETEIGVPVEIDPESIPAGMQPHELIAMQRQSQPDALDALYNKPDARLPVRKANAASRPKVNPNRVVYHAYFEPGIYVGQAKERRLKFTEGNKYPVHAVRENPNGGALGNMLSITDDTGRIIELEEVFFTPAGQGLLGDDELGFSESPSAGNPEPRLSYHNELTHHGAPQPVDISQIPEELRGIPIDDGSIPVNMEVPDIRGR